ncbi:hypothetical protein F0P96_12655 [Hymenobacter busanensis]|uniref:Uncharacterized protein n=1 Tax=Hymenobacter busanensis TaxID=2607656 RepID=A0A7L4ZVU5_9BACT|nr:hypothetical protein [Hymenobacter busanensis]KAA9332322.1 hypothetical protein F0P96_12655 [Hymenobacter busanensis]QHJ07341.1 hypothetical protein GUY19_08620 [Hymenobacter busanensis]
MAITYRMNTDADEAALVDLWTRHSDWGSLTVDEWEHKFLRTPGGPATFVLAVEDDTQEIVAQTAYVPYPIVANGHEITAFRPFGIIVNESFRSKSGFLRMQQMVIKMYTMAADQFASQGVDLLFMMPDPRWSRIVKMMPFFQTTTFPLWSHPLPLSQPEPLPSGYAVAPIEPGDARIDELWQQAAGLYRCMVTRDTRTLPWKISHGAYQLFGVSHQGQLVGFFASIAKRKDNQWLLTDMVTADNHAALQATLRAACLVVQEQYERLPEEDRVAYRKIAVLSTPPMEPVLQQLGFQRDKYDFLLVVHALNKKLTKEQVSPAQWYVSAND